MTARLLTAQPAFRLAALVIASLVLASGCCCYRSCGDPCGGSCGPGGCSTCCFSLPRPIVWDGCCNDCGPDQCTSCGECPQQCGILPWLIRSKVCGKGCGEIYWGEWISDPPDCCDPCDPCHGCWTGPQGCCNLGPTQRLLAALHGYSYCPAPYCGPVCGLCHKGSCGGECCGPGPVVEGHVGCATCGGGHMPPPHEGDVYYPGTSPGHIHNPSDPDIMHENWNIPRTRPIPGKPIHKAQQPLRGHLTGASPPQAAPAVVQRSNRQAPPIGSGVRMATYQR